MRLLLFLLLLLATPLAAAPYAILTRADGSTLTGELAFEENQVRIRPTNAEPVTIVVPELTRLVITNVAAPATNALVDPALAGPASTNGLLGYYFSTRDLTGSPVVRLDAKIEFDWGDSAPAAEVPVDNFSARWRGHVRAQFNEPYTFFTMADDGARLWINNILVINSWRAESGMAASYPMTLVAGQSYPVRLEMFEAGEKAAIKLMWSSPSTPMTVIASANLVPDPRSVSTNTTGRLRPGSLDRATLLLRDGSQLLAAINRADSATLGFIPLSGTNRADISTVNVAAIWFASAPAEAPPTLPSDRTGLLLRNGDFLEAQLVGIDRGRIRISSILFGLKYYGPADLSALVLHEIQPGALAYRVKTTDGSLLLASALKMDGAGLTVHTPSLGHWRVPWTALAAIEKAAVPAGK